MSLPFFMGLGWKWALWMIEEKLEDQFNHPKGVPRTLIVKNKRLYKIQGVLAYQNILGNVPL